MLNKHYPKVEQVLEITLHCDYVISQYGGTKSTILLIYFPVQRYGKSRLVIIKIHNYEVNKWYGKHVKVFKIWIVLLWPYIASTAICHLWLFKSPYIKQVLVK